MSRRTILDGGVAFALGWGIAFSLVVEYAARMLHDGMPRDRCIRMVAHYGSALAIEMLPPMAVALVVLARRRTIGSFAVAAFGLLVAQEIWNNLLLRLCPELCAPNLIGVDDLQNLLTTGLWTSVGLLGLYVYWKLRGESAER